MSASTADRSMWVSSPSARRGLGLRTNAFFACTVRSYGQAPVRRGHTLDITVYGLGMTQTTCPFGQGTTSPTPTSCSRASPSPSSPSCARPRRCGGTSRSESIFDDGGYWVISRHEDIKAISRNGDLWSTNRKGAVMRLPDGVTADQLDLTKALLINHDAPEHTRLRKIVSRLFTPRSVAALEEKLAVAAHEIVAAPQPKDAGNFVDDIAMRLPLLAIADLIGVPEADREKLFHWTNAIMNTDDPDFDSDPIDGQRRADGLRLHHGRGAQALPGRRHRHPADPGRHRRRGARRRRVRVLRDPARGRGQRDHPQRDDARHERVLRKPRPVGAVQARAARDRGRRDRPLGHAGALLPAHGAGRHRARRRARSARASASACSTARPTTTRRSSTGPSSSTSCETPTRTWPSAATARTSASAPTWPAWRSS